MAAAQVQHSPPVEAPQSYIEAKKPCCSRKRQRVEERVRSAAEPTAFLMYKKINTLLEKLRRSWFSCSHFPKYCKSCVLNAPLNQTLSIYYSLPPPLERYCSVSYDNMCAYIILYIIQHVSGLWGKLYSLRSPPPPPSLHHFFPPDSDTPPVSTNKGVCMCLQLPFKTSFPVSKRFFHTLGNALGEEQCPLLA